MRARPNSQKPRFLASVGTVSLYELFANYGEELSPRSRIIFRCESVLNEVHRDQFVRHDHLLVNCFGRGGEIRTPDLALPRHAP